MGRDNQKRRKEKRQRNKVKKKRSHRSFDDKVLIENLLSLLSMVLSERELPPASMYAGFQRSYETETQVLPLAKLIFGFMDYLFKNQPPIGSKKVLQQYKSDINVVTGPWLYRVLDQYCALSEDTDLGAFVELARNGDAFEFVALVDLYQHSLGEISLKPSQLSEAIDFCLCFEFGNVSNFISSLKKFISLKNVKPSLKAVRSFDDVLGKTQVPESAERDFIAVLVRNTLKHRSQLKMEEWQLSCPYLAAICEKSAHSDELKSFSPSHPRSSHAWYDLAKATRVQDLPFSKRIEFEALSLRILGEEIHEESPEVMVVWQRQLNSLTRLLCSGVPPAERELAQAAVRHLIGWLVDFYKRKRLSPESGALSMLLKHQPRDYRLHVFQYLQTGKCLAENVVYENIDDSLFYVAYLQKGQDTDNFRKQFFYNLSHESQSQILLHLMNRLLYVSFGVSGEQEIRKITKLVQLDEGPVAAVMNGQTCSSEFLFAVCLIAHYKNLSDWGWLRGERIMSLLRTVKFSLQKGATHFHRDFIGALLSRITEAGVEDLFRAERKILLEIALNLTNTNSAKDFLNKVMLEAIDWRSGDFQMLKSLANKLQRKAAYKKISKKLLQRLKVGTIASPQVDYDRPPLFPEGM